MLTTCLNGRHYHCRRMSLVTRRGGAGKGGRRAWKPDLRMGSAPSNTSRKNRNFTCVCTAVYSGGVHVNSVGGGQA